MATVLKPPKLASVSPRNAPTAQPSTTPEPALSQSLEANPTTGLAGFNLTDLAEDGRRQLDRCRELATRMIGEAKVQADAVRKQAELQGYAEGLQRASEDNDKKIKTAAEQLAKDQLALLYSAVEQLYRSHETWMNEFAQSLTSISLSAADRIVRAKLESERAILIRWAAEAIASTRAASKLTLALHPEMLVELGELLDDMVASPEFPNDTHVIPDATLSMTDIVVRQEGGDIQAGLAAQLERLSEMLG